MGKGSQTPGHGSKGKTVVSIVIILMGICFFGGIPFLDWYNLNNPVLKECTVESARISTRSSGTRGIATSSTRLIIDTAECGKVYISRVADPGYRASWKEMEEEVNKRQGQKMTLLFEPIQLPAEGGRVEGLGFVL